MRVEKRTGLPILILFLVAMLCTLLAPAAFAQTAAKQTYGLDNLNNEKGELVIAFLGGSITVGSGSSDWDHRYSTMLTKKYFKKKFPNKTVREINGGVSGTNSDLGLFRMSKDITDSCPDVVFVEFAVNDSGGGSI